MAKKADELLGKKYLIYYLIIGLTLLFYYLFEFYFNQKYGKFIDYPGMAVLVPIFAMKWFLLIIVRFTVMKSVLLLGFWLGLRLFKNKRFFKMGVIGILLLIFIELIPSINLVLKFMQAKLFETLPFFIPSTSVFLRQLKNSFFDIDFIAIILLVMQLFLIKFIRGRGFFHGKKHRLVS